MGIGSEGDNLFGAVFVIAGEQVEIEMPGDLHGGETTEPRAGSRRIAEAGMAAIVRPGCSSCSTLISVFDSYSAVRRSA